MHFLLRVFFEEQRRLFRFERLLLPIDVVRTVRLSNSHPPVL